MKLFTAVFALLALGCHQSAYADWVLQNDDSKLSLVTTKAGNIAELHHFKKLSGKISGNDVTINIHLGSIDTKIEIRDQRMRDMLFETEQFPTATVSAKFNVGSLGNQSVGNKLDQELVTKLSLHGEEQQITMPISIVPLSDNRLMVLSRQPIIVNAGDFKLIAGVEKLREVASLPSISNAVPVSFVLVFEKKN